MSKGKVTVLGSNGHIGHHAVQAFQQAGWTVTAFGRSNKRPVEGVRFMQGDANALPAVTAAIADADVVVYALHLPYDKWGNGAAEAQLQVVIDALGTSGKTLMFPGTIYNYSASDRLVTPQTPQVAEAPRGEIRIRLEAMLAAAAAAAKFRTIILRAGDFFGPGSRNDWFDQAMLMDYSKGVVHHMGPLELRHSWAYLPDLADAFVALAERRSEFAAFENFHFAGHWVSHRQMMAAIGKALPRQTRVTPLAWWGLAAIGLVNPVMRDIYRMRYLWRNEMELSDPRLDDILGKYFGTPFERAVAVTVDDLLASPVAKAA